MSGKKGGNQKGGNFQFNFNDVKAVEKPTEEAKNASTDDKVPSLVPMVQKKLQSLVGQSSGYFESLSPKVQNRIRALKKLQKEKEEVDEQYQKEKEELEKKYREKWAPFYVKRTGIISGADEPAWIEPEVKEEAKDEKETKKDEIKDDENVKGIPNFWCEALRHHQDFGELIMEQDVSALEFLANISVQYLPEENHSFALEFTFKENPYFENASLTKTYHLFEHPSYGEIMFDRVDATEVKWKTGKNLTKKSVTKTQGGRGGRRGGKRGGSAPKTITVEEPCPSFFNFFNPDGLMLTLPDDEEGFGEEEMEGMMEFDYELGCTLKDVIVPNAVLWYTGEAAEAGLEEDDEEGHEHGEDCGCEDEEGEGEEEEGDDDAPAKGQSGKPAQGQPGQPECKQQ